MLSDEQLDWLAGYQGTREGRIDPIAWGQRWAPKQETIAEWMADPEFNDAYMTLVRRYAVPLEPFAQNRIRGRICSGTGQASLPTNVSHDARLKDWDPPVERGTLNILPDDLGSAVAILARIPGTNSIDVPTERKGHLVWWPVMLHSDRLTDSPVNAWLIRHERNALDYLELMGRQHFRKMHGFVDGDTVEIEVFPKVF